MYFIPKTDEELSSLWPEGEYPFEIIEAIDYVAKTSGKESIRLNVLVFNGEKTWKLYDYISPSCEWKLKHFCSATRLMDKYDAGSLTAADCNGKHGKCQIVIDQDKEKKYPKKNVIKDYCKSVSTDEVAPLPVGFSREPQTVKTIVCVNLDDDLPF